MLFPIEDKGVVEGAVAVDGVLWQGARPPCVDAADAMNIEVDVQIDKAAATDLMGVTDALQVLFAVVPGTDAQRLQAVDAEGRRSV